MDRVRYPEGDLPAGAVSVRLCPGRPIVAYDGTIFGPGIQPPADVLTTRIDELIAEINDLPTPPEELACPGDGGPRLTYWFGYPDGDAQAVTFERFGCDLLWVGEEAPRTDGARVARLFTEALLEQRAASGDPPGAGPPPACEGIWSEGSTALPVIPADLQTATVCVESGRNQFAPASMPTQLVEQLENELTIGTPAPQFCEEVRRPFTTVLALTPWGDRIVYPIDPCGQVYLGRAAGWPRGSEASYALADDLLAQLDALPYGPPVRTESATTTVSPPATPG
jgi:hypothetical protein